MKTILLSMGIVVGSIYLLSLLVLVFSYIFSTKDVPNDWDI